MPLRLLFLLQVAIVASAMPAIAWATRRPPPMTVVPVPARATAVEEGLEALLASLDHLPPPRRRLVGWLAVDIDAALAAARVATTRDDVDRALTLAEDLLDDLVDVARSSTTAVVGEGPACAFDRMFAGATSSP